MWERETEREREGDREGEGERQRERHVDRERQRERERKRDIKREKYAYASVCVCTCVCALCLCVCVFVLLVEDLELSWHAIRAPSKPRVHFVLKDSVASLFTAGTQTVSPTTMTHNGLSIEEHVNFTTATAHR